MGLTQKLGTIPLAIQTDSSNNVGIGGAANASFKLAVTGNTTITGNLGIGTTSPSAFTGYTGITTDGSTGGFYDLFSSGNRRGTFNTTSTLVSIGSTSTTDFALLTNNTARMTITSTGNVGIGTTNPTDKLTISGRLNLQGLQQNSIWFNQNAGGTSTGYIVGRSTNSNDAQNFFIYDVAAGAFRMTITSDGQLQIKQSANTFSDGIRVINTANNTWTTLTGGDNDYYFGYNGNAAAKINSAGTYTAFSDRNRKKDFEESNIGLDAILGLKPTLYRIKTDDENADKQLGFIAQEVKDFIPQAYSESINGDETFIGLNYNAIVTVLVKAIQELNAKVTALENK